MTKPSPATTAAALTTTRVDRALDTITIDGRLSAGSVMRSAPTGPAPLHSPMVRGVAHEAAIVSTRARADPSGRQRRYRPRGTSAIYGAPSSGTHRCRRRPPRASCIRLGERLEIRISDHPVKGATPVTGAVAGARGTGVMVNSYSAYSKIAPSVSEPRCARVARRSRQPARVSERTLRARRIQGRRALGGCLPAMGARG